MMFAAIVGEKDGRHRVLKGVYYVSVFVTRAHA